MSFNVVYENMYDVVSSNFYNAIFTCFSLKGVCLSIHAYTYIHVSMHACMCVYACVRACVWRYVCVYICMPVCVRLYMYACVRTRACMYVYVCVYVCICVYMCVCIYMEKVFPEWHSRKLSRSRLKISLHFVGLLAPFILIIIFYNLNIPKFERIPSVLLTVHIYMCMCV